MRCNLDTRRERSEIGGSDRVFLDVSRHFLLKQIVLLIVVMSSVWRCTYMLTEYGYLFASHFHTFDINVMLIVDVVLLVSLLIVISKDTYSFNAWIR